MLAADGAAVQRRARREAHVAVRGGQPERGVRERHAAELGLAELEVALRVQRAQHVERQVDRVERAFFRRRVGRFRRRQVAVDVDVVDGEVVARPSRPRGRRGPSAWSRRASSCMSRRPIWRRRCRADSLSRSRASSTSASAVCESTSKAVSRSRGSNSRMSTAPDNDRSLKSFWPDSEPAIVMPRSFDVEPAELERFIVEIRDERIELQRRVALPAGQAAPLPGTFTSSCSRR